MSILITKELVNEAIRTQDSSLAVQLLGSDKESRALDDVTRLKLSYLRLNGMSTEAVSALMSESVLTAYKLSDYSLFTKIKEYIEQYDYVPDAVELCGRIPSLLSNNQEQLGSQRIPLGDKQVAPTVSNWLNHYAAHSTGTSGMDVLGLMKYFNTNPDLKVLNASEKAILKDIIQLQDYCNAVVAMWESLPNNISQSDFDVLKEKLGVNPFEDEPEEGSEEELIEEPETTTASTLPTFRIPLQKNLDLSTQPKSGLVFDQPTNVDLDQEAANQAQERRNQMAIQAKLEALKQRQSSDEDANN